MIITLMIITLIYTTVNRSIVLLLVLVRVIEDVSGKIKVCDYAHEHEQEHDGTFWRRNGIAREKALKKKKREGY